ncbi:hypothetical protein X797_008102 [Metarhizium robertsii]|uniref:Uncharacterized protein n=1 Tax=Metarhizium robertsii TaxID=568076 RepID=A0A014P7J4_9HYPO|nr:hypothetical protein X797_008102 [Metarhizium robertsii]
MLFANLLVLATAALGAVIKYDGAEYDDGQYDDQFLIGPPAELSHEENCHQPDIRVWRNEECVQLSPSAPPPFPYKSIRVNSRKCTLYQGLVFESGLPRLQGMRADVPLRRHFMFL